MRIAERAELLVASSGRQTGSTWQPRLFLLLAAAMGMMFAALPPAWSAALLVSAVIVLLILIYPLMGVGLVLLAGPLGALENVALPGIGVGSGQALLFLTVGSWLAGGALRRRITLPHTRLNIPLAMFVGAAALTVPGSASIGLGLKELLKWIEVGAIMVMVVDLADRSSLNGRRATFLVLSMLLLAGLSQALVGIWQFGLRGHGPEHFSVLGRFFRAYGTFEQPNPFGGFMSLSVFLGLGTFTGMLFQLLRDRYRREGVPGREGKEERAGVWTKIGSLAAVGVCAVSCTLALFFSWSRGAWLGFAAGVVVLMLFLPRKLVHGAAVGALAVVLGGGLFAAGAVQGVLPSDLVQRVTNINQGVALGDVRGVDINDANYAVLERLAHWQAALEMARDHLWTGVGFGNYEAAYSAYALINWPDALGHAHNYYLNLLAEVGMLGLSAYLLLWGSVVWRTIRIMGKAEWPERGIAVGLLAAWASLSVHHLVDKLYVNNIYLQIGVMLGLLQLLAGENRDQAEGSRTSWMER